MNRSFKRIPLAFWAIALLIVASLACSPTGLAPSGGGQSQPTAAGPQPTQPPAKTAAPGGQPTPAGKPPTPTAGSSGLAGQFAKPDLLNSYRARLKMGTQKKDGSQSGEMSWTMEWVKEPPSRHITMGGDMQVITIQDTTWVKVGGKWMQQTAAQRTTSQTPDSLLPQEDITVKQVGEETFNGIHCKHYTISGKVNFTIPAMGGQPERKTSVPVQGEVWVADQSGLPQVPIRQRMEMEGSLMGLLTGAQPAEGEKTYFEMELYDINTPITIQPPEGAQPMPGGPTPSAGKTPPAPQPTAASAATPGGQQPPAGPLGQPTTIPLGKKNVSVTVKGTDAIYLAGRADVTIPPLDTGDPDFPLMRCGGDLVEAFPASLAVSPGAKLTFKATGLIRYYGPDDPGWGPDGGEDPSDIPGQGGISPYLGPQGALVRVFLDNSNPKDKPEPDGLEFDTGFAALTPALGQVFFIGDGLTDAGSGDVQTFVALPGATRLFLGIADASSFTGEAGCYSDNVGSFQVEITLP